MHFFAVANTRYGVAGELIPACARISIAVQQARRNSSHAQGSDNLQACGRRLNTAPPLPMGGAFCQRKQFPACQCLCAAGVYPGNGAEPGKPPRFLRALAGCFSRPQFLCRWPAAPPYHAEPHRCISNPAGLFLRVSFLLTTWAVASFCSATSHAVLDSSSAFPALSTAL